METKLVYLEYMDQLTGEAQVVNIVEENGKTIVILDQTIFYPQGGGQPYDTGEITSGSKIFRVNEVRFISGIVHHIGTFESEHFVQGENVTCIIDAGKRNLHSRIHSAGHIVDMALKKLGVSWKPGKGYHFPNGPYVEYSGTLENIDIDKLKSSLEEACNEITSQSIFTKILFMKKEEMGSVCQFVPEYIPENKPGRVVMYGDFGIPCGGTHVANLNEIGKITIRKIKKEGENIRVSYQVESGMT